MSNTTESTSNSIKFAPMPVSALLANLWPLQQEKTPDTSFTDDSDDSVGKINNKTINNDSKDKVNKIATPKNVNETSVKKFTSEKKLCDNNKENVESNWSTNQTHQKNDFNPFQSSQKVIKTPSVYINSEKKRHNVISEDYNSKTVSSKGSTHKKTPEATKLTGSTHKTKTATPTIKSGIRKFTPGSKHSHKKTPLQAIVQNRDKVRCELFGQNQGKKDLQALPPPVIPASAPVQSAPVPETPVNKKLIPASYVATPSYPQGIVGNNNSKILFKTTSIKDKKYMFIKKLGTGGSSEVYKVLEVGTSCEYAVKCVYLATDQELAQGYINEVRLLRELQNSDRVVRLYDYEYDRANQFLRMVLEVGETDLSSFLRARGSGLPPALVLHYWEEMLHAVHYIHDHGVIHADLKPANFLLVCGRLKLIDFGIASAISSDATSVVRSQAAGTYSYISPEALMGGAGGNSSSAPIKISFRSDVWSLGCILYSMVYGRTPFGHIPNLAKLAAILDPNHRIEYSPVEHLPQSLIASLKWCLTYVARARPTVRELLAVKHLQGSPTARRPLPATLIDKLRVHCTSDELTLLQQATT